MSLWEKMIVLEDGSGAIKVSIEKWKGKERFDLRYYYFHTKAQAWSPTQKGIMVAPEQVDELITTLIEAKRARDKELEN